jgi:hypothetical protein
VRGSPGTGKSQVIINRVLFLLDLDLSIAMIGRDSPRLRHVVPAYMRDFKRPAPVTCKSGVSLSPVYSFSVVGILAYFEPILKKLLSILKVV